MPSYALGNRVLAGLVASAALASHPIVAQENTWVGARFGVGLDTAGELAGTGQVEIVSLGDSGSAELAFVGVHAGIIERYGGFRGTVPHRYREETEVTGVGVLANYLFGYGRDHRGPYLAVGLGGAGLDVAWEVTSPTDNFQIVPCPLAGCPGRKSERGWILGTLANLGLGYQVHRNADVRAQAMAMFVSSTVKREDMKFVPAFTFSTAIGF